MKTGLYGGTFNPIHLGHLHILEEFIRRLSLDRVLLIPTKLPPHKQAENLADEGDRAAMCRLAAQELQERLAKGSGKKSAVSIEVSDIELRREGKSYTADTLRELREDTGRGLRGDALGDCGPEEVFYLLMGEDMFLTVDSWYRPETIFALSVPCASPRSPDGYQKLLDKKRELERNFSAHCVVEDISYFPASSTEIRALSERGESLSALVSPAVADYIAVHGLYRKKELPTAEQCRAAINGLSPSRLLHSEEVAKTAVSLAAKYGADEQKALVAGLLHDIMKETERAEQLKVLEKFGILLSKTEFSNPKLWHAITGAAYVEHVLGVEDREVLNAIRYHTSGRGDMSRLEQVIFTADFISADREYPGVKEMRRRAKNSLEDAMLEGISFTVSELMDKREPVAACTVDAYNDALAALRENAVKKVTGKGRSKVE